jgi:hypothetical protein
LSTLIAGCRVDDSAAERWTWALRNWALTMIVSNEAVGLPKLVGGVRRGIAGAALSAMGTGRGAGLISGEMDVEGGGIDNAINRVGDRAAVMSVLTRRSGRG